MVSLTEKRKKFARDSLRRQVDVIRSGTPMAEAALPLHKSVYTSQKRYEAEQEHICLLYTSPSPRDRQKSRMPSSA